MMASHQNAIESKLIRAIIERLLKDDFSPQECWVAADAFENGKFCKRLATVIRAISEQAQISLPRDLSRSNTSKKPPSKTVDNSVDDIFALYKRRKIAKQDLISLVEQASESKFYTDPDSTAREILTDFIALATPSEIATLVSRLQPAGGTDPYLKGILRRG
jgi:hypothetical protein